MGAHKRLLEELSIEMGFKGEITEEVNEEDEHRRGPVAIDDTRATLRSLGIPHCNECGSTVLATDDADETLCASCKTSAVEVQLEEDNA